MSQESSTTTYDPRLLLLLVVFSVALVFSTSSWFRLLLIACILFCIINRLELFQLFWQRVRWLRWFIFSVVLMHMLFSPGYTMFGVSWLTYEGLSRGLMVSFQVVLAMGVSLAFSRALSAERMIAAGSFLLKPLAWIGVDVAGMATQVRMTLDFVPHLRQEGADLVAEVKGSGNGVFGRIAMLKSIIEPLVLKLIDRADRIAHEQAAAVEEACMPEPLPGLWPLGRADVFLLVNTTGLLVFYWLLP